MAPANSIVTAVGVERDGFRYGNLTIAASMLFRRPRHAARLGRS